MDTCLTDQDLADWAHGAASPEQISAWDCHVAGCERCAARLRRVRESPTGPAAREPQKSVDSIAELLAETVESVFHIHNAAGCVA
jgi:hypothetical protein